MVTGKPSHSSPNARAAPAERPKQREGVFLGFWRHSWL